jgi:hypothetical protein
MTIVNVWKVYIFRYVLCILYKIIQILLSSIILKFSDDDEM